ANEARLEYDASLEHNDGIHRAVSGRPCRNGRRLVGHTDGRPYIVCPHASRLHHDLSAPRQRRAEAVILKRAHDPLTRRYLQCARPLRYRAGPPGRLCGAIAAARASVSPLPAPAHPVRLVGGGADSEYPLWAPPEPLCGVAVDRRRRRGFRRAADFAGRTAGGSWLWFGAAWLSLLYMGLYRLCRRYSWDCSRAAFRQLFQELCRAGTREGVRAHGGVARAGAHRAECDLDAAGMRLRGLPGQPARLRTAQAKIVRVAITPRRFFPVRVSSRM